MKHNVIGYIQGAFKRDKDFWSSKNADKNQLELYLVDFYNMHDELKEGDVMKAMQRMVRAKYKGYEIVKNMKGFITNPNHNKG